MMRLPMTWKSMIYFVGYQIQTAIPQNLAYEKPLNCAGFICDCKILRTHKQANSGQRLVHSNSFWHIWTTFFNCKSTERPSPFHRWRCIVSILKSRQTVLNIHLVKFRNFEKVVLLLWKTSFWQRHGYEFPKTLKLETIEKEIHSMPQSMSTSSLPSLATTQPKTRSQSSAVFESCYRNACSFRRV